MEPRHNLPSTYPSPHLPLDDPSGLSRLRQPLTDAAGNSQLQALAPAGIYHDNKFFQPRAGHTVPSQPPRQTLGSTLELRRQGNRRRRHQRQSRNPIVDSPQYQAYRARQNREGNLEDAKWPGILEDAFLDALVEIPPMGRRKFSYKGKPHGRNELIKEYLWIAYLQSLAPGQPPDQTMRRTRKQVSSHIQVLKGFLHGHPAYDRLFPSNKSQKNGFEDSFKNDPCLRALSEGRLPTRRYEQFESMNPMAMNPLTIRPVLFWLLITLSEDEYSRDSDIFQDGSVAHRYTALSSPRNRENLESISRWRQRFPYLERHYNLGDLNCDIIHMDVSLQLMESYAPDGAELRTRMEISIPSRDLERCQWQTVTSLIKPQELYRDPTVDPPMESKVFHAEVLSVSSVETRIKVPFPAMSWAHTFTSLTHVQSKYEEERNQFCEGASGARSVRELTEQISMYQEVLSCAGAGYPFIRRAIILWTFRKARSGEPGVTTWRYIDAQPSRSSCMSPSPHPSHQISASMSENFNTFLENPMHLPNMLDPFVQGLATPPNTGGLQSPFTGGYSYPQHYEVPTDNLSFESNTTMDSESTLVDDSTNIDHFLSNTNVDYDHNTSWNLNQAHSFDTDPAWINYATVPASTPHLEWDDKIQPWPEEFDAQKHDWGTSPSKEHTSFDQPLDQKLLPWTDSEVKHTYPGTSDADLPELIAEPINTSKEQNWVGSDGFDYSALAERLKQ